MADELLAFDDLTLQEVPVSIGGKRYILREASGEVACRYRNRMLESTEFGGDGKPMKVKGMGDLEPLLVSLCLWEADDAGKPARPVPESVIRAWPSRVVKRLFAKAKAISDLGEEATQDAPKEGPNSTGDGSS